MPPPGKKDSKEALQVGALIKRARRRKKLTQDTLGKHLNLSQPHVSRIENGDFSIASNEVLVRAAKFLQIDPRDLLRAAGRSPAGATFEELTLDRLDRHSRLLELTQEKLDDALRAIGVLQESVDRIERMVPGASRAASPAKK
jgi:transcriptional regulator with XRE-family HTH domain